MKDNIIEYSLHKNLEDFNTNTFDHSVKSLSTISE